MIGGKYGRQRYSYEYRAFCGSCERRVPTGIKLMAEWHKYLKSKGMEYIVESAKDCGVSKEKVEQLFAPDYKLQSEDYFALFDLRFAGKPIVAYRYLQKLMENAEPSIGYYMLAVLMDNTENKLVITTNFDTLVEDVLYLYHAKHPLVAGHESLAPFIGTVENMGRPVVAKVHRDLTLQPLNREEELQKLADAWAENLHTALSKYIPIVIGYSGGDQTLMNLLEKTKLDNIYWCSLSDSESERIENLLKKCPRGYLVKIKGFDDVMFSLVSKMMEGKAFDRPIDRMKKMFHSREENYNKQYLDINKKLIDEETAKKNGDGKASTKSVVIDETVDSTGEGVPVADSSVETVEIKMDLLDKMASKDRSPELKAASLRREAYKYYSRRDYEKALEYIEKAIAIKPDDADLHDLKALILHNADRFEEALKERDEAVRIAPDNAEYHFNRGLTLDWLERYEEALKEKDEAVRLAPYNAEYHDSRGTTLDWLERHEEALKEKDEAVRLAPDNAEYHYFRGITLHGLKRYEEALKENDEAVRLAPRNAKYHDSRGTILDWLERYEEALKEKDEAVRLAPDNAEYHYSRGITLHGLKRYEEALKEKDEAVRLAPRNAEYHNSRGTTLRELGRYEEALEECNKAVRIASDNARYRESRSIILHELDRYEEALEDSNEAVRLAPDNARYHDSRGRTLRKLGRIEEAQEEFNEADRIDPDNKRYEFGGEKSE